jgi:hypothetical protein
MKINGSALNFIKQNLPSGLRGYLHCIHHHNSLPHISNCNQGSYSSYLEIIVDTKLQGDIAEQAAILYGLKRGGACCDLSEIGVVE